MPKYILVLQIFDTLPCLPAGEAGLVPGSQEVAPTQALQLGLQGGIHDGVRARPVILHSSCKDTRTDEQTDQ